MGRPSSDEEAKADFDCTGNNAKKVDEVSRKQLWQAHPFMHNSEVGKVLAGGTMQGHIMAFGVGNPKDLEYTKYNKTQPIGEQDERFYAQKLCELSAEAATGNKQGVSSSDGPKPSRKRQDLVGTGAGAGDRGMEQGWNMQHVGLGEWATRSTGNTLEPFL